MKKRTTLLTIGTLGKKFAQSESGMTLPLLALSMVGITGMTGMAVDVARTQLVQSKLQFSLDAAGLAAGSTVNSSDINEEVTKYLNGNFDGYLGAKITHIEAKVNDTNTIIDISASAALPTTFMGVVGVNEVTVSGQSQITRAVTGLELIMVLDNTGSMKDTAGPGKTKIEALKDAATSLVKILHGGKETVKDLWIGMVPFAQAVNIGTSHPTWVSSDTFNWGPTSWLGCVDARVKAEDVVDDPPTVSNSATIFAKYYWPSDTNDCWAYKMSGKTKTCTSTGTGLTYYSPLGTSTKGPNLSCSQEVTPMTGSQTTITNAINSMQARGNTHINQGLLWGWNMISPKWRGQWGGEMDSNGLPLDYHTKGMNKAVVLLTDGDNVISNTSHGAYWYLSDKKLGTTNQTLAEKELDSRVSTLCTSLKNQGVYVYTIALGEDISGNAQTLLKGCATAENYYFYAPSSEQLESVFSAIGDSLSSLRVSK